MIYAMYPFVEKVAILCMAIVKSPVNVVAIWVFMARNVIDVFHSPVVNTDTAMCHLNVSVKKDGMVSFALIVRVNYVSYINFVLLIKNIESNDCFVFLRQQQFVAMIAIQRAATVRCPMSVGVV